MKLILRLSVTISVFILTGLYLHAQENDPGLLTVERIFDSQEFRSDYLGPMQWLEDGSGYTVMEFDRDFTGMELAKYDIGSGEREVLVTAGEFIPEGAEEPLRISSYTWSPDQSGLLLFTNTSRVWRYNTKGDYWIFDRTNRALKQLGKFADPSNLKFAKYSPDGKKVGYVYYNNIYVEDLASGEVTQLTFNGSETLINGTFDWVYEEEFHARDGFRWSPDSKYIAYWQMDASVIREFYMINNTDSLYPYIIPIPYPKVGQELSTCRVGVIPASGGKTVWMKTGEDLRNNYIPRMEWAASSEEIVFQYMNRLQNQNQVMLGDIHAGEVREVFIDRDEAWLDVVDDFQWIEKGKYFTWLSERSGWRHIYLVSRDGKKIRQVTKGDYDVISVELIDEEGGYFYFIASPDNATERYLFRTKLKGGKLEKLSPELAGHHSYDISPGARYAVHTYSGFSVPAVIELIELPDHEVVMTIADNSRLKEELSGLKTGQVEFFKVEIENSVELDGWMIKPYNFDP